MSTITKKQHYVPQFLLKNFSKSEKICIFDATRNSFRKNVHIKNEFSKNYFYDQVGKIDPLLDKGVETPAAPFIDAYNKLEIQSNTNPSKEVLRFLTNQIMRTPSALTQALGAIDAYTSEVIKQIGARHNFPEEFTKNVKIEFKNPKKILTYITAISLAQWPLIQDLGHRLLINQTGTPFVISDNPVITYNKYLQDCDDPAKTSLPAKGLIIFLPISSKVTLCLYDRDVYRFKNRHQPCTSIFDADDINILNEFQAMNREDSIIFSNIEDEKYVRVLCKKTKPNSLHETRSGQAPAIILQNKKLSSMQYIWRTQAKIEKWISVISIKKGARPNKNIYAQRDPENAAVHKSIMDDFQKNMHKYLPNQDSISE